MKNDKFLKNQTIELLRDSRCVEQVPKGSVGIITHTYPSGNIRLASNLGKNYRWEIYLHSTHNFSEIIKVIGSE